MMSEELAAAGLPPIEEDMQETEIGQLSEENLAGDGSENREEGEIGSEGENIEDVDADMKDLVAAKRSKPLPPSFIFRESGFFPTGSGRAPLDELVPTPEADEIVVFRDFFTCGLRFPCDPVDGKNSFNVSIGLASV
jgi:hypothetical protein